MVKFDLKKQILKLILDDKAMNDDKFFLVRFKERYFSGVRMC